MRNSLTLSPSQSNTKAVQTHYSSLHTKAQEPWGTRLSRRLGPVKGNQLTDLQLPLYPLLKGI